MFTLAAWLCLRCQVADLNSYVARGSCCFCCLPQLAAVNRTMVQRLPKAIILHTGPGTAYIDNEIPLQHPQHSAEGRGLGQLPWCITGRKLKARCPQGRTVV